MTVTVDFSTPNTGSGCNPPDVLVRLELVRPSGTVAATTATCYCSYNARLDAVPINETGTWTMRVRAYEQWVN